MKVRPCRRRHVAMLASSRRRAAGSRSGPLRRPSDAERAPWRCAWRAGRASAASRRRPRGGCPSAASPATSARSNSFSRQCRISFGSGIIIGQTLSQRPQKVEAFGRCARLLQPEDRRVEHRAHRAGIGGAVSVAADRVIDRAMVHAGAAADAAQHLLILGAEHRGAAVVEDDDVIFLRPVGIARAGAGRWRRSCRPTCPGPVAERASRRRMVETSFSVGTIFSIEAMTMWMRGRICVRSPLPSLVTMIEVPVSATRKFAPVMPTSAARKRSRRMPRASASRLVGSDRSRSAADACGRGGNPPPPGPGSRARRAR